MLGHWEAIGLPEDGKKKLQVGSSSTTRNGTQTWTTNLTATTGKVLERTSLKLSHKVEVRGRGLW